MLFLEIEHPERDRVVLPLRDGVFAFPPASLARSTCGCRLRITVKGETVLLQPLGSKGHLRQGSEPRERVELRSGECAEVDSTRLTVRSGSASLLGKRRGTPSLASVGTGPASRRLSRSPPRGGDGKPLPGRFSFGTQAGSGRGQSAAPPALPLSRKHVAGRDRWVLMSLYAAGCVGRRDLARALIIRRNDLAAGTPRDIAEILRKTRFLGNRFDAILRDVEDHWCLACTSCRRVFEPERPVLDTCRCLECDRRLTLRPRAAADESLTDEPESLPSSYDRLPPGTRLGDYKIEQLLGIGGYGAVYRSFDTQIQRRVALKVFPSDREEGDDVLREARNVAAFPPHPNLVLVYHVGQALGFDYISYEYVSGRSLAFHIERRTHLTVRESLRLLRDVLNGLATAHQHGVIHRDLKPDNILLVRIEGQFRARITDFGLGQRLRAGQGAYHSRTIRGAPEYLAPEQFRTQVSSVASDLYSVGATFFHLLTGRAPFTGTSDHELAERHLEDPVPSLSEHLPGCPAYLEILFQKLLAKDPKDRPVSAEDALSLLSIAETAPATEVPLPGRSPPRSGWLAVGMLAASLCIVALERRGGDAAARTSGIERPPRESALDHGEAHASLVGESAGAGPPDVAAMLPDPEVKPEPEDSSPGSPRLHTSTEVRLDPAAALEDPAEEAGLRIPALEGRALERDLVVEDAALPVPESPATTGELPDREGEAAAAPEEAGPRAPPQDAEPVAATVPPGPRNPEPVAERPPELAKAGGDAATGGEAEDAAASGETPAPGSEFAERFTDPGRWLEDVGVLAAWIEAHGDSVAPAERAALEEAQCLALLFDGQGVLPRIADGSGTRCFLQRNVRETLEGDRPGEARSEVAAKIYRADQVAAWLDKIRERTSRSGLDDLVHVGLPSEGEARRSDYARADRTDLLEWIQDAGGQMVLFDHHTMDCRPESRASGFSRLSAVRLHLCVTDLAALQKRAAQCAAALTSSR